MPLNVYFSNLSPQKLDTAIAWQVSFAKKYKEAGWDFVWLVFSSKFDQVFKELKNDGLHVEIIPTADSQGLKLVRFLFKYIIAKKVDVIHMHFIRPWNAIMLIILSRIFFQKTVFLYHKRSPGKLIANKFNIKKYVNPLALLSLFVDKIICNSDSIVENCVNRGVSRNKVDRVYNGIAMERFENIQDTGRIRKEFNIPQDHRIVTSIKDARPEVGLEDLLISIPTVLSVFPNTTFLIVGGGVETDRLQVLTSHLGIKNKVIFAGIRNDIPDIISESYCTVDPSPVEAFGNVVVESMAAKRPVIAVNAWGPKEIIVHGETGLLVEVGHPTNFAPAIIDLLASSEKVSRMGIRGYERVKKCFTVEHMVSETVELTNEYRQRN